jgi:hypothetical protein
MKGFIVSILIFFIALSKAEQENEEVSVGDYSEGDYSEDNLDLFRITGGTRAKPRLVPSYVALQIYFDHGTRTCGGFLGPAANQIVTAANCVFE